ncbi:putative reverse transcriptase domain-containing protein [Tanacetum coccineum]|uniref:Reverse transcriptase domain-containing protein n=1 Tax=Tanacetum coccineum TaxID=301880 RepID=A0ABQ5GP48_9ASTR
MALMKYCDKHNQVGFLKKPEESTGFAKIVDILKGSHIRYALTHNLTIHDSIVKQFWQTATASTLVDRTLELRATIDTIEYTITEASVRSKLQLADASGISMLPNTEIFEGMGNMGYPADGVPRPLLSAMLLVVAVDQSARQTDQAVDQPLPSEPLPSSSHPPAISATTESEPTPVETEVPQSQDPTHPHVAEERTMSVDDLLQLVPKLLTKVDSLETELKQTKLTMGKALVKLGKNYKRKVMYDMSGQKVNTVDWGISTGSDQLVLLEAKRRKSSNEFVEETLSSPKELKKKFQQEEASLAAAIRLQTLEEEEIAKQVHLDALLAKRMEEEELTEQQKQRKAQNVLGKEFPEEDFAKKIVELVNQRKFFAKERAKARRSKPMTQSLSAREEFDKLVKQVESFVPINIEATKAQLVMQKYGTNRPEDANRVLWSDLRTLCSTCLNLESMQLFNMLANRKYPLSKDACQVMRKMKILDGKMNEVCYKLLKMIEKQVCGNKAFVFGERPNEAIDVPIEDEKSLLSEPRGSPPDESVDAAIAAERARQANVRNDASGYGLVRGRDTALVVRECTFTGFMKCNPAAFHRIEGAVELRRWFEKTESVFEINECVEGKKVKFAAATLEGPALTWWKTKVATIGLETVNQIPWTEMKQLMTAEFFPIEEIQRMEHELWNLRVKEYDIVAYTQRFNELALKCSRMVELERVKVDAYIRGLTDNIKGKVTSSKPADWNEAIRNARAMVTASTDGKLPLCERCYTRHVGQCTIKCHKCGKVGHKARYYREKSVAMGANAQPI